MNADGGFDMQAAWLRRFSADAQGNLAAFALRLKEALPEQVTIREKKGLFSQSSRITGLSVELGDNRYVLELAGSRLVASIALVVRGIALNTRSVPPADWFERLGAETRKATDEAASLSRSLAGFMAS